MRTFLREIIVTVILAAVILVLLQAVFQTFIVVGSSMEPSFSWRQRLLVNKAVYHFHEPERGDVIVLQSVDNQNVDYIKRIIALPGDTVEVKDETVYVNGLHLDEPYIKELPHYTLGQTNIPDDNYFVLGDNRNNSNDSHKGWLVPRDNIVGKAWLSFWPPDEWGLAPNYPLKEQLASPTN
ncbi:MAG: signal peptidase I [Dehalococcoidales bacterium]|nr:signal peptidase I [Dehalococcoidales bacterium]